MDNVWKRLGIPICLGIILLWFMKPGGSGFMPLPITPGPAPTWALTNLDGTVLHSSNLLGRVVVFNVWATWCPPCIKEIPDLQALHTAHQAQGLTVLGVSVDQEGPAKVKDFVQRNSITYPVVMSDEAVLQSFSALGPIPTTFIIDRQGQFVARYVGPLPREELERVTAPLLAKP
jgi:peroxiredoxin